MAMKKILLVEPEKEQSELFSSWLKEEGYKTKLIDNFQEVHSSISKEKFDILLMDIDYPEIRESSLELCQKLKKNARFSDLPVTILTYKKDVKRIASAIEAGVDNLVLKPFETDSFLKRIKTIFKEIELKKQGKKVLDLNYINFLIKLLDEGSREDFFLLSPVIFNRLVMDKIGNILGESVIMVMMRRIQELTEDNYAFMRQARLQNKELLMDDVYRVSKKVSVKILAAGFQNFIYTFLSLVRVLTSDILMEEESQARR